jgi:hypothetical protein
VQPADISAWTSTVEAFEPTVLSITLGTEGLILNIYPRRIPTARWRSILNGKEYLVAACFYGLSRHPFEEVPLLPFFETRAYESLKDDLQALGGALVGSLGVFSSGISKVLYETGLGGDHLSACLTSSGI